MRQFVFFSINSFQKICLWFSGLYLKLPVLVTDIICVHAEYTFALYQYKDWWRLACYLTSWIFAWQYCLSDFAFDHELKKYCVITCSKIRCVWTTSHHQPHTLTMTNIKLLWVVVKTTLNHITQSLLIKAVNMHRFIQKFLFAEFMVKKILSHHSQHRASDMKQNWIIK